MKTTLKKVWSRVGAAALAFIAMFSLMMLTPMTAFASNGWVDSNQVVTPPADTSSTPLFNGGFWSYFFPIFAICLFIVLIVFLVYTIRSKRKLDEVNRNAETQRLIFEATDSVMQGFDPRIVRNQRNEYKYNVDPDITARPAGAPGPNPPQNNNGGSPWY